MFILALGVIKYDSFLAESFEVTVLLVKQLADREIAVRKKQSTNRFAFISLSITE